MGHRFPQTAATPGLLFAGCSSILSDNSRCDAPAEGMSCCPATENYYYPWKWGLWKSFPINSLFQGKQAAPSTQCWAREMGPGPSQTIPKYPGLAHSPWTQGTNYGHQEKNCENIDWQSEQYGHLWSFKVYPSRKPHLQPELEIKHLKSKIICGTWMSLSQFWFHKI